MPRSVRNIGKTVVTSSSEMMRGLVRVIRSRNTDGGGSAARPLGGSAESGGSGDAGASAAVSLGVWRLRATTSTSATHTSVPASRCAARSHWGRVCRTMVAATMTCSRVTPRRPLTLARSGSAASSRRREIATLRRATAPRNRKASTRWIQCSAPRGTSGGSNPLPWQRGNPGQTQPALRFATLAPRRMTRKPRPAVARTRGCQRWRLVGWAAGRLVDASAGRTDSSPALSAVTWRAASSNMALARWAMTTPAGSSSLTVTAPRSTWTISSTSASRAGSSSRGLSR